MAWHDGLIEETPANEALIVKITGKMRSDYKNVILKDGMTRRINGRFIVGSVPVLDKDGKPAVDWGAKELITRRQRFRIPKGHPWRGKRP